MYADFLCERHYQKLESFQTTSSMHSNKTRKKQHLRRPKAKLSCFQESTFYAGIKIFTSLRRSLTVLKNDKTKLKAALGKYWDTQWCAAV